MRNRLTPQRRKTKRLSKKSALILVLFIITGAVLLWFVAFHNSSNHSGKTITPEGKKITLSPPTQDEKKAADDAKQAIVKKDEQIKNAPQPSTSQLAKVNVVITEPTSGNPNKTNVRAYVTGIFEDDGTCTATATQGSTSIVATSTGVANSNYTQCTPMKWSNPLAPGMWTITVTYKSSAAAGSQSTTLEVQ
jgi:hypothetical protein